MLMNKNTLIGNWVPGEMAGCDYSRQSAAEEIELYKQNVGDIDFGSGVAVGLFAKYLAEHASGNDTMRGYFAASTAGRWHNASRLLRLSDPA